MNEDKEWEAFHRELVSWCSLPEFRRLLRAVSQEDLMAFVKVARRLDLMGDAQEVEARIALIMAIMENHKLWQQRSRDITMASRIFAAVGGVMLTAWAVWDRFLVWFMK